MTETTFLAPHDPIPDGHHVLVLRRFCEDDPDRTVVQILLTGPRPQTATPRHPDGRPMDLDGAITAARQVAREEGLDRVFVLDRTQGRRERDVLRHGGDRSVHMEELADSNEEEGEHGPDMRDLAHRPQAG